MHCTKKGAPFGAPFRICEIKYPLFRQLVVHAFDVEVHAEQRAVVSLLAGLQPRRAALLVDRAGEGMQFTGFDLCVSV
jgi:hypothetical protein